MLRFHLTTAAALVVGCSELADIRSDGRCGNRVLEPSAGETCDSAAPDGLRCGAPGTPLACRLLCGPNFENAPCPDGWTCGADGACRVPAPSFTYLADAELEVRDPYGVKVADFDGDGHDDLAFLSGPKVIVRYGDGTGAFSPRTAFNIDAPLGDLAVGDLDYDGRADLVVPEFPGPLIVRGEPERTLSPVAIPILEESAGPATEITSDRRVVVVPRQDAQRDAPFNEVLALQPAARMLSARFVQGGTEVNVATGVDGNLAHHLGTSEISLFGAQNRTIAVSYVGDSRVFTFDAGCDPTCSIKGLRTIPLDPLVVSEGAFVGDVNGDGFADIVVAARAGDLAGRPAVGIAFGQPGGGYCSTPGADCSADSSRQLGFNVSDLPPPGGAFEEAGTLVALSDLDGDGRSEFIFTHGILQNLGIGSGNRIQAEFIEGPRFGSLWREVTVGDFNKDGLIDLAAIYPGEAGIEFLMAAGNFFFGRARLDTEVTIPLEYGGGLHVGDYDGDLFDDLAFATEPGTVRVAFGDPQGSPTEVVSMGSFGLVLGIAAGHFNLNRENLEIGSQDLLNDLMILSSTVTLTQDAFETLNRVTLMTGTTERRMLAPVLFFSREPSPTGDVRFALPTFVKTSNFATSAVQALDLLTVTREQNQQQIGDGALWLAKGRPGGQFALDGFLSARLDDTCDLCAIRSLSVLDLIGELVEQPGGAHRLIVVEKHPTCGLERRRYEPLIVDLSLGDNQMLVECQRLQALAPAADETFGSPRRLRIIDVDHDSEPDMLILRSATVEDLDPTVRPRASGLQWYRGPWTSSQAPGMIRAPRDVGEVLGFAQLSADRPHDVPRLVLVGSRGLAVGQLDPNGTFTPEQYVVRFEQALDSEAQQQSLRTFDVNGDRLEDIVLLREGHVTVFARDECTAILAEEGVCSRPPVQTPESLR